MTTADGDPAARFADRVVVVTGGSAGIGLGIARTLGGAGARVALWARRPDRLDRAQAELAGLGIEAIPVVCDIGDEASVDAAMRVTAAAYGRVDVMVANAGRPARAPLVDTSFADWSKVVATNLTGTFLTFRAAARDMIARSEPGALLATSSLAARGGYAGMAGYAATKAGIEGLVRTLAVELAPHRIRCNALVPGYTVNSYFSPESVDADRGRAVSATIPAGRWGTPDDIGVAALYLADPALSYHTGASIVVDGAAGLIAAESAALAALR